ncbi:phosphatase PAP2 family protein [bacterium]|jgi:undecaprenyl-diphosphatase|nr:phosphatase PAP2 family protein [bacterium]MBT6831517.1 phosphatase PAP2 family protein [bacterium]MBT6996167.1 phosphatase PAP2 family protein [bacterium]MBT7772550.1 phosphatase PAP2 family protein [bacterium]
MRSEINFHPLKREFWIWIGAGVILFALAKISDQSTFAFVQTLRCECLDDWVIFLTEKLIWGVLMAFAIVTGFRVWKNPDNRSKLLPACFALVATAILGVIFKSFFAVPRPFETSAFDPLVAVRMFSFPSVHTALAFALMIPMFRISKWVGWSWLIFALVIGFARVYENVHFPSDIAGGIFLGGVTGAIFSHPATEDFLRLFWRELEFRRQSFHFLAGFLSVFAHWVGFFPLRVIAILLLAGLVVSWFAAKGRFPFAARIFQLFDRPRDSKFPGRGAFYFLLGVGLSFFFFDVKIAYAAILILSVGDSFNHLFAGRMPQIVNFPWNRRKNLVGVVVGILMGTFAAQFFVPGWAAFFASSVAIFLETIPFKFRKFYLDDNVFVPLVAGAVLYVLM